jgi:hypothetical protein
MYTQGRTVVPVSETKSTPADPFGEHDQAKLKCVRDFERNRRPHFSGWSLRDEELEFNNRFQYRVSLNILHINNKFIGLIIISSI